MLNVLRAVFVVATIFALSGFVFADMIVDLQGNVGVGTETPETKLDVDGTIQSRSGGYKFPDGTTLDSAARFGSPPLKISVGIKGNTTSWDCECNVDLEEYCGDEDGCKMRVLVHNETESYDEVRCIEETIYMEQADLSANRRAGVYGWSRNSNGDYVRFRTGAEVNKLIFSAWDWVYMYNYTNSKCPGMAQYNVPYTNPYEFTFVSHPQALTTIFVYD